VHAVVQLPQWAASVLVSVHAPLHDVSPAGQLVAHDAPVHDAPGHTPSLHVAPAGHWTPQAPQFDGSVDRNTHAPLQLVAKFPQTAEPPAVPPAPCENAGDPLGPWISPVQDATAVIANRASATIPNRFIATTIHDPPPQTRVQEDTVRP
jgi:hypothetical protein